MLPVTALLEPCGRIQVSHSRMRNDKLKSERSIKKNLETAITVLNTGYIFVVEHIGNKSRRQMGIRTELCLYSKSHGSFCLCT